MHWTSYSFLFNMNKSDMNDKQGNLFNWMKHNLQNNKYKGTEEVHFGPRIYSHIDMKKALRNLCVQKGLSQNDRSEGFRRDGKSCVCHFRLVWISMMLRSLQEVSCSDSCCWWFRLQNK